MASILKTLGEIVGSAIGSARDQHVIQKDDIVQSCQTIMTVQNALISTFNSMSGEESKMLVKQASNPTSSALGTAYKIYTNKLGAAGKKAEVTKFLGAAIAATDKFASLANEIITNIDVLMKESEITLNSTRVSHAAAIGIIRNADLVSTWTIYMLDAIRQDYLGTSAGVPKYRPVFINTHAAEVAEIVSAVLDKSGRYTFMGEVANVRRKGQDLLLYSNGQSIENYGEERNYSELVGLQGFSPISIGLYLRRIYDDWQHSKYVRNQQLKSWMEARSAMIRLRMEGVDPSDPEYRRLENIVNNYDELITKYDQKINKYLSEFE